jgi:nucleotide-binding universal stress UspA family protein
MKLLIGYDGSECSKTAIKDLIHAGLPPVGEAVVLTAADVWPGLLEAGAFKIEPGSQAAVERFVGAARVRAEQAMTDARSLSQRGAEQVAGLFPQWRVSGEAIADSPHWALIKRADGLGADLIVVGSHGHSALQRAILGSVSQNVLHHASCSVRIARGPVASEARPLRILLGIDGSVDSATAVAAVQARSWPGGTEIRVVTAADLKLAILMFATGSSTTVAPRFQAGIPEDEHAYATRMLETVARELREAGLTVSLAVRDGDPKRVLLDEARDWAADSIFIGSQGLSRVQRLLIGSVSAAVATRAPCSVEVVRSAVL